MNPLTDKSVGRSSSLPSVAAIFLEAVLVVILFWPTFSWMNARYFEGNSYYSHGWLVPAAVSFLLWRKREEISRTGRIPCWGGISILIFGLFLHLAARLLEINFISALALFPVIMGLVVFQEGWPRGRLIWPPLLLLLFMIPLPGVWIISITFHLKNFSADAGVALARLLGVEIAQQGIEIILPAGPPGQPLTIGDPCSGLRSLISFGSLGGFFSLLLPLSLPRRLLVLATAVALAPFSNVLRIFTLILLRLHFGPSVLDGFWHIALGVVIFFFCFIIFLRVLKWLLS